MPVFLKYGKIKGDVDADGHKDWINLLSVSMGTGRHLTQPGASGRNREAGKATVSEVSCMKELDEASVHLFQESVKGLAVDAQLHFCTVQADKLQTYYEVTLKECMLSSFSQSTQGDGRPVENFSINYTDIEHKFIPYDTKGGGGAPVSAGYDLKKAVGR